MNRTTNVAQARRLTLAGVRRRLWIVVVAIVGVGALAYAGATLRPVSYEAEALVVATSGAREGAPGDANDATKLAATDALIIGTARQITGRAAREIGTTPKALEKKLTVLNDTDTALIRIRFKAKTEQKAIDGARAVALFSSGAEPATPAIAPGSLEAVRLPTREARRSGGSSDLVWAIGAVLGLLLGCILLAAWERADPRVDDVDTLADAAGAPASSVATLRRASGTALLERFCQLTDREDPLVALLPVRAAGAAHIEALVRGLEGFRPAAAAGLLQGAEATGAAPAGHSDCRPRFAAGAVPGGPDSGEGLALHADLVVVVADPGAPVKDVENAIVVLERFGAATSWALLTPRRAKATAKWAQQHAQAVAAVAQATKPTVASGPPAG